MCVLPLSIQNFIESACLQHHLMVRKYNMLMETQKEQFIIEVLVMKWRGDAPQVADCWWSRSPAAASWSVPRCGAGGAGEDTECLLGRRRQGPGRGGAAPERLRVLPRWSVIMTSPHWLQLPHYKSAFTHVLAPNFYWDSSISSARLYCFHFIVRGWTAPQVLNTTLRATREKPDRTVLIKTNKSSRSFL